MFLHKINDKYDGTKWAVGMMSGTSMDGIDVAAVRTDGVRILERSPGLFVPYSEEFTEKLRSILGSTEPSQKIFAIQKELTDLHGAAFFKFVQKFTYLKGLINLIGFHGQAILHRPPSKFPVGFRTWQIGDGALLARLTGIDVVANMREKDVMAGGEGAPLVSLYHQALAKDREKPLTIVNIGGTSNVTWLGKEGEILAFDLGPGNGLLNDWMSEKARQAFDESGKTAARGHVHEDIIKTFFDSPYFSRKPPKSLDRLDYSKDIVRGLSLEDGAATLTEIAAIAIARGREFVPEPPLKWLLTGGGAHNEFLVQRLQHHLGLTPAQVQNVESVGWSSDFMEAEAWAFLAVRSRKGLPLSLPTTTGVPHAMTGGDFFKAH